MLFVRAGIANQTFTRLESVGFGYTQPRTATMFDNFGRPCAASKWRRYSVQQSVRRVRRPPARSDKPILLGRHPSAFTRCRPRVYRREKRSRMGTACQCDCMDCWHCRLHNLAAGFWGLSEVHFALSSGCRSLDLFLNPINLLGARGLPERSARRIWAGTSQPWFRHSTERGGESLLKVESSYTSGKCALLMIKTNLIQAHGA